MDEKEFRQWIQRIQSLQEEATVSPSTSQTDTDDDITQDLIAAFRYGSFSLKYFFSILFVGFFFLSIYRIPDKFCTANNTGMGVTISEM